MEKLKIGDILARYQDKIPEDKMGVLKNKLERADDSAIENLSMTKLHNPISVLLFSIFLGGLGVDRFVIGDIGVGVCKLLFGALTFGLWAFIDIFICYKKAKEKNLTALLNVL